jgi:hypothetical protein
MASPVINELAPSERELLMKDQRMRLTAKNGRNSSSGVPKINPNTKPIVAT